MDLRQRKLFNTKEFECRESGLYIRARNLVSTLEYELPYEEIFVKKIIRQKKNDGVIILVGSFFALILIIGLIGRILGKNDITWSALALIFILVLISAFIAFANAKRLILIPTANNGLIEVFDGRPNADATDQFVFNLTVNISAYLKAKYASIDPQLPIENQLANLMWLKEREVIDDQEFEGLKNQLFNPQGNPIGFGR